MAAVDSLLSMVTARSARSLTITSAKSPSLDRGNGPEPMSMPPLGQQLIEQIEGEVFCDGAPPGSADRVYEDSRGNRFAVSRARMSDGICLVFTLLEQPVAKVGRTTGASAPAREPVQGPDSPAAGREGPDALAADSLSGSPLSPVLTNVLAMVGDQQISDVLVSSELGARVRVAGELRTLGLDVGDDDLESLLRTAPASAAEELERTGSCDFPLCRRNEGGHRYRVNLFRQHRGLAAALRPIRTEVPTLSSLNLPDNLRQLASFPHGLVLVTGQAGSGKSTTLVALVEHINRTAARHIITLEDPIEYEYKPIRAMIHQRQVGVHVSDFATGLRAALRESPDVVLVGEMRDRKTVAAALTAAETGHLVLSTLHAASAEMALDRIIDQFAHGQQQQIRSQLAGVLRATLTQFLLPTTAPPNRRPAYELMVVNAAVAAMIRDGKSHQIHSQIQTGRDAGMVPLDRVLEELVRSRSITREVALGIAREPARFR